MVSKGDVRRLFLQSILSRGTVSEKLAQAIWSQCIDAVQHVDNSINIGTGRDKNIWNDFLKDMNDALNDLDLEFKTMQDESTGRKMCALVNVKGDEVAQLATDFTVHEIAYFKALVEQIMLAPRETFSVSSLAALREVGEVRPKIGMSKTQAEVVLGTFVAKGWLLKSKRGRYSLGNRTILELSPYLKSTYPDQIVTCFLCNEVVTKGISCHGVNCTEHMHYHCFKVYRNRFDSCKKCKSNWPKDHTDKPLAPVGEDGVRERDDAKRRVRSRGNEETDGEERDEDEDEDMDGPTQKAARPSHPQRSQRRRNQKTVEGSEDDDDDEE